MFESEKKVHQIQTLPKGLAPHFRPRIDLFVGSTPHKWPLCDPLAPPTACRHIETFHITPASSAGGS